MPFMTSDYYAECRKYGHYAECHYAECHYAKCRGVALLTIVTQCLKKFSSSQMKRGSKLECLSLVTGKPYKPSLMFASEARAYTSG
jgi:hypothetical protein